MSSHKFLIPAIPSTSKGAVSVEKLVKNKWPLPCTTSNTSGVAKNVTINGKTIPLKVLSVGSLNKVSAPSQGAPNAKILPTFKLPSKNASFSFSTKNKSKDRRDENLSSDSEGEEHLSDNAKTVLFPINKQEDVYKMETDLTFGYMKSLYRFLRRQLVGKDNVTLQLLEFMYTPECMSKFNVTGKRKKRFKSLKINQVLMKIANLKEKEYWQSIASAIHVMERRNARGKPKSN